MLSDSERACTDRRILADRPRQGGTIQSLVVNGYNLGYCSVIPVPASSSVHTRIAPDHRESVPV